MKMSEYGLQLYSVRDFMERDVESTLRAVAEIGYKYVEFAGFFDHSAEEIRAWLDKYGLICSGTHTGLYELTDHYDACVQYHKTIGCNTIIIPGHDLDCEEKMRTFAKTVNELAPRLAKDGMRLGYHNHAHEFKLHEDGFMIYPFMECLTNISLELDTYWAFVGGTNSIATMRRLAPRLCAVHVKDGLPDGSRGTPLGQGNAPVAEVVKAATALGIPMVVESENLQPDGLTEARVCFAYLKSLES